MEFRVDDIEKWAKDNNCSMAQAAVAVGSPLITKPAVWPDVEPIEFDTSRPVANIATSQRGDLLTEVSKGIADYVQFPANTAYLHAMGVTASAMTKGFSIDYGFDTIPCNLYIITAQPPSTGKSAVNGKLYAPIFKAYEKLNEETATERKQLIREIARLEKELSKDNSQEGDTEEILDKMADKQSRLDDIPEWEGTITDATIEAAEMVASNQKGMFSIISAEAESVNVVAGAVYGDDKGGKKANQGLLLSAWDGEYVNTKRVGRKGYRGYAKATISVIAQDDSVDTILAAGASGRGLTERFLLLCEPSKLGQRDHYKKYRFDKSLYSRYESMIENVIREDDVKLRFSDEAEAVLQNYKANLEPELGDNGKFSNALLTGFMGKADKHIRKIASVLHVSEAWQDGGSRSNVIDDDCTMWAIGIFDELSKTFVSASDSLGYVGRKSEVEKLRIVFTEMAEKGKLKVSVSAIRDKVKNVKPFKGSRNVQKKLKEDILPTLEESGYIVVAGNDIHINPRLK